MTDYSAFVPVVNRPDLLENVFAATTCLHHRFTIIDNSPNGVVEKAKLPIHSKGSPPIRFFRPPVPLSFSQTMNWAIQDTMDWRKTFCITMHNDAVIPEGACEQLLEFAHQAVIDHPRWGVIFTHYDVLAVHNPVAHQDIGGWDTNLPQYFSDNDYFRRLKLAKWECIDSGIEVGHLASSTINSDPYLRHMNGITFPIYGEYYRQKWGGTPGEERFTLPFNMRPVDFTS